MTTTIVAYHYSLNEYAPGFSIEATEDHRTFLTDTQAVAEDALRAFSDKHRDIRKTSVYAWLDQPIAERTFVLKKKSFPKLSLYEVQIEPADLLHKGDLIVFNDIETAVRMKTDPMPLVAKYWAGVNRNDPRIEILSKKMRVVRKLL